MIEGEPLALCGIFQVFQKNTKLYVQRSLHKTAAARILLGLFTSACPYLSEMMKWLLINCAAWISVHGFYLTAWTVFSMDQIWAMTCGQHVTNCSPRSTSSDGDKTDQIVKKGWKWPTAHNWHRQILLSSHHFETSCRLSYPPDMVVVLF